jgi:LysR family glycine cleavage system transcriptional activator
MQLSHLPLNALRAFEATIRLGSVTAAAAELNVSQGAVSRHVKNLETRLQASLVRRNAHKIQPTATGEALAFELTQSFQKMTQAVSVASGAAQTLRLQVSPTFANRWLIPQLGNIRKAVPEVEIALTTTLSNQSFDARSFDAGIIYGDGHWPELEVFPLLKEVLVPICAPQLATGQAPPKSPKDLKHHMLLHAKIDRSDWRNWFKCIGNPSFAHDTGPSFETMDLAIASAERGFGIALGNTAFISQAVKEGRLQIPFGPEHDQGLGYFLVHPRYVQRSDLFEPFYSWIREHASDIAGRSKANAHNMPPPFNPTLLRN